MTNQNNSIIDSCQNMFGNSLTADCKRKLKAVLDNPTTETWDDACSVIINPKGMDMTLWQAWCAIDTLAPKTGRAYDADNNVIREWSRIPDQFTLYRAIKYATEQQS